MNENIHNEKVASFQVKVKEHENDVIEGKKVAHDINEFIELHTELNGVIKEYEDLYKDTQDEKYKIELDAYLKEELDYLDLISELMDNLEKYHDTIGVVDTNEIQQEWEDVRTMVIKNNLSRSLKRMEKLAKNDEKYASLYEEYKTKHDKLLDKAINAEYRFIKKFTLEQNTTELESDKVDKTPAVLLNEEVYEKMNLSEKINYLEIIMQNIEKTSGKKRTGVVNGKRIDVTKKYYARYVKYSSMLNNLYEEKKIEEENIINNVDYEDLGAKIEDQISSEINSIDIEKYWEARNQMSENKRAISVMEIRSESAKEEECIHVESIDGKSIKILKTDLETFENIEKNNNQTFEIIETIMVNNNDQGLNKEELEALFSNENSEENDKSIKDKMVEKIKFLRKNGEPSESLSSKIKGFLGEYCTFKKTRRFIEIASLARMFEKRGYSKEESLELAKRFIEPYKTLKNNKISDENKKNLFGKASDAIKSYFDNSNDSLEENVEEVNQSKLQEILKAAKSLPKKASQYISKVKETKKPKNKLKLREDVKKRVRRVAVTLGFTAMLTAAAYSSSKNAKVDNSPKVTIENDSSKNDDMSIKDTNPNAGITEEISNVISENSTNIDELAEDLGEKIYEQANQNEELATDNTQEVSIGNVFTTDIDAPIYTNMYDASQEVNQKNAYFEAESNREITGIAYDFNGSMVLLDANDPDLEAKKSALESNGAKLVAVRSENEAAKGYEGYFNIDDINMGGRSR